LHDLRKTEKNESRELLSTYASTDNCIPIKDDTVAENWAKN